MASVTNRRQKIDMPKSIKNKFAAAVCMLLVGAIMMVSASYAWFTLSTAPEVKGITTNVGANGNLEIMLLDGTSLLSALPNLGKEPNIGDSMESQSRVEANLTWGNLVDLGDSSYGLSDIILAPAALNITDPGTGDGFNTTIDKMILKIPSYGADGRVQNVNKTTTLGSKTSTTFTVLAGDGARTGVSAIGSDAGVSPIGLAYRTALQAAEAAKRLATATAQSSLSNNAETLANLLMRVAQDENATFDGDEIVVFNTIIDALDSANEAVLESIKQSALAYAISTGTDLTEDDVSDLQSVLADETINTSAAFQTALGINVQAITDAWAQYEATKTLINSGRTQYSQLSEPYTYASQNVKNLINTVFNKAYVTINGYPVNRDLYTEFTNGNLESPLEIVLSDGSGLYYEIAKSIGDLEVTGLRVMGVVEANMSTSGIGAGLLKAVYDAADDAGDPAGDDDSAYAMSDLFGYIIDMGFRTNAPNATADGSALKLQGEGIQRIYNSDGTVTNIRTQGAGTYISFSTADTSKFDAADVKELMGAVRIVFVTPVVESGEITGYTILHMAAPDLSDIDASTLTDTVTAPIAFYEFSSELVDPNAEDDFKEVVVTLGDKKDTDVVTMLQQNQAQKVSVIVYLDGDAVDNTMVANAKTSMTGKLNLQFKTDADLVPMDVASLKVSAAESLRQVVDAIKADTIYTDAQAAADPTAAQTALLNTVAAADDALAADPQVQADILSAAQALKTAALAAGIPAEAIGY